jgi:hypothetical protein
VDNTQHRSVLKDVEYGLNKYRHVDAVFRAVASTELPSIKFKPEWDVVILPPFGGATMRFVVRYKKKSVSVYCDHFNNLGYWDGKPYWEMYPLTYEGFADVKRFDLENTKGLIENIEQELEGIPNDDH